MREAGFICAAAVQSEVRALMRAGVSPDAIRQATGLHPDDLSDPDEPVAMSAYVALEQAASTLTGRAAIGLHLGMEIGDTDSQTGIVGYLAVNSPTVREGFHLAIRYSHLLSNASALALAEEGDRAEFHYARPNPLYFTVTGIELALSRAVLTLQMLGGDDFHLWSAHFQYPAPAYVEEYRTVFGSVLRFEKAENKIIFGANILNKPTPGAQPYVQELLLAKAEALSQSRATQDSMRYQVQSEIIQHLPTGGVAIDEVATRLGFSRHTIYRRLQEEGTFFRSILEETRKNLADHYLRHTGFTVSDIALLLGFSEASAFHRAFKRWYGCNPKEYAATRPV